MKRHLSKGYESLRGALQFQLEELEDRLALTASVPDFWIEATPQTQEVEAPLPALINAHNLTGVTQVKNDYGFAGTGQTVAVIDTGIAWDHYALGGGLGSNYRVVGGWDFAENDADPYDDGNWGGHGTHVSGIIGANDGNNSGVASDVDIVSLRVFSDDGSGFFSWTEAALQWVHDNQYSFENPITTVNLSIGTSWNSDNVPGWAMLEDEFAQLEVDGIFISVAAGNSFTSYNTTGLSYPAASQYVVPVSSVDDDGQMSYFSQRNSRVIAAPGRGVLSTVPDYTGNNNGIADDWASMSGTSMAAPYVAGSSVLIRQALAFMGQTNITQDQIYGIMRDTADLFYDSATAQNYHRLNMAAALDSIMPDDDYGSTINTAYNMGSFGTSQNMTGLIGQLDDQDFFSFTASQSGRITIDTTLSQGFSLNWQLDIGSGQVNGGSFEFDVIAGQTYTVGVSASNELGFYDLDFSLAQNTIEIAGSQVTVYGTEGDDTFVLNSGDTIQITVNGVTYDFANTTVDTIIFVGGGGNDSFVYYGTSSNENAQVRQNNTTISGIGYNAIVLNTEHVTLNGGGGYDVVQFHDTAGDDHLVVSLNSFQMTGTGYSYTANDFEVLDAWATQGGNDTAEINGTAGNDVFESQLTWAKMFASNYYAFVWGFDSVTANGGGGYDKVLFFDSAGDDQVVVQSNSIQMTGAANQHTAVGFEVIDAWAFRGGNDTVEIYGTAGNDVFESQLSWAKMYASNYYAFAWGFDSVTANGGGGYDTVLFYDTVGDDQLVLQENSFQLIGGGNQHTAVGFEVLDGWAVNGGNDTVQITGTAGNDVFESQLSWSKMFASNYYAFAWGFDSVTVNGGGGYDKVLFYDTAGDDQLVLQENSFQLTGAGNQHTAVGFEVLDGWAVNGGNDTVQITGTAGNDLFESRLDWAKMFASNYYSFVWGFDSVTANGGQAGQDSAYFYDSIYDDQFHSERNDSWMSNANNVHRASNFDNVYAYSTKGGNDVTDFYDTVGDESIRGELSWASMTGDDYSSFVNGFGNVKTHLSGGNDTQDIDTQDVNAIDYVFELL